VAATRQLAKRQLTWLRGGNLLPTGAKVLRGDAFDDTVVQQIRAALIKAAAPP
jgi:tRNA A37 N6-isopentenylltransferase MiaA